MGPKRLRRFAIEQAVAVAKDPDIQPAIKEKLLQHVTDTAIGPSVYGRLVYRVIAIALGLVAILVVVFAFVLLLDKHTIDSAFYTLGSAAVGALGGVFAPHANGGAATPSGAVSPGSSADQAHAPHDAGTGPVPGQHPRDEI